MNTQTELHKQYLTLVKSTTKELENVYKKTEGGKELDFQITEIYTKASIQIKQFMQNLDGIKNLSDYQKEIIDDLKELLDKDQEFLYEDSECLFVQFFHDGFRQ
jgi:hypothetical protein